jgi:hypothetical protein
MVEMSLTTGDAFLAEGVPFRYRWSGKGDQYRLERVSDSGGSFRVPERGEVSLLTRDGLPPFSIVVGEEGSGLSTFRNWLSGASSEAETAEGSKRAAPWRSVGMGEALKILAEGDSAGGPVRLILDRRREAFKEFGGQVAELAALIDRYEMSESWQIVCITSDVEAIQEDLVFSSLASRGTIYRVPHFDPGVVGEGGEASDGELEHWVMALVDSVGHRALSPQQRGAAAVLAKRWTGGQPSLTHLFFRRCADRLRDLPNLELLSAFESIGDALRTNPPQIARRHWAAGLRAVLKRRPESADLMLRYIAGQTKVLGEDDFPPVDVELFMIGWVGYNHNQQWGIRSACHRQWARAVISGGAL